MVRGDLKGGAIKALTIKDLPPGLAEALEREQRRRGQPLNQVVIDLLDQVLRTEGARSNGLGRDAAGWSEDEFGDFSLAIAQFEELDGEVWR